MFESMGRVAVTSPTLNMDQNKMQHTASITLIWVTLINKTSESKSNSHIKKKWRNCRHVGLTSSTLHAPKQQKANVSAWTTFKWAELNDISAALQSLSVGIHPLSPQLPYGMLTQHLAPSDQQLHPLNERMQPVCNLHLCQHRYIYTTHWRNIHIQGRQRLIWRTRLH